MNRLRCLLTNLARDRHGAAAMEFALVSIVLIMFIIGIADFGRALFEWNQATKATQEGARVAIVSDLVAEGLQNFDGLAFVGNGTPVPLASVAPNPIICTSAGCNGYGPLDAVAFNRIATWVGANYARAQPENIVIEYRHIGLGFAGNPVGPDIAPAVTVRLQNLQFDFIGSVLFGLAPIQMPDFATTLTGEDFGS